MSDETARIIDREVKSLIERNYVRARTLLMENMDILHSMKDALMKYETIDAPQIDDLMNRKTCVRRRAGTMRTKATAPTTAAPQKPRRR